MKKIKKSFYQEMSSYLKKQNFYKINNLVKDNLWLTPLIYIIGTIALLIRNKILGLQFTSISFIQFALIVVYLVIFLFIYSLIELNFILLFDLVNKKDKYKIRKIIGYIILHIIYFLLVCCIIYILIENFITTIKLTVSYFILWPIFLVFLNNRDKLSNIINIIFFITLIMEIPISLGGFKGQSVVYHEFNTNKKENYVYYGNYDGLYQFKLKDNVVLIPIDSGYIEYKK